MEGGFRQRARDHRPRGKFAKPTTREARSHRILANKRLILKYTGTRLEGGDLRVHAPLPLGCAESTDSTGREEEKRRGKKELRGYEKMGEGGDQARETRESTRWNLDEAKDEERPPREEWPTAMKILTGTLCLALADRLSRSFYYCFFLLSLLLHIHLSLALPLPASVSLSSGTIYRGRVQEPS